MKYWRRAAWIAIRYNACAPRASCHERDVHAPIDEETT